VRPWQPWASAVCLHKDSPLLDVTAKGDETLVMLCLDCGGLTRWPRWRIGVRDVVD